MSIVTLKKKTLSTYKVVSTGVPQFSLNGTRRSQGYVGQTSLSRSLPKTMMKGNVACGYGGCCGTYNVVPIVQSAVTSLNNPNVVKSSVVGTSGMIQTKYRWVRRPQPYATVKPDSNLNLNTQNDRTIYLKKKTLNKINSCTTFNNIPKFACPSQYNKLFRSHLYIKRCTTLQPIVEKNPKYLTKTYTDDYDAQLDDACTAEDTFYVANNSYNYPFGSTASK